MKKKDNYLNKNNTMVTVKRLFISLLVLLGCTAGAWAIEQDSDGYYLIGSVQDWKDLAELVNGGTTNINARMIADIDLGDDQTHIGSMTQDRTAYSGIFDGQGYTLTVAYVGSSKQIVAPFTQVIGATIKNLHVDGSIQSAFAFVGVVGYVRGGASSYISNIWMSANASCNSGEWHHTGSIVGSVAGGSAAYVTNCLFTGTLTSGSSYSSTFIGCNYGGGIASSTNCLSTGTLNISGSVSLGTSNNCYVKQFPRTIPEEMQVTDEQLADGTIATALGDAWAQDPLTHQPVPKIFTTVQDEDGNYLIGSVQDWKRFAAIVETTPNANAKMTADVDLGDDQTVLGSPVVSTTAYSLGGGSHFKGVFDGQGHTLTVAYTPTDNYSASPFSSIEGATIKNLHIAGTMVSPRACGAGVASATGGTGNLIQNVWVSAAIIGNGQNANCSAGIIGCVKNGSVTISDCIFTGSLTSAHNCNGCFVGFIDRGSAIITNSLSLGTIDIGGAAFRGTHQNCYVYQFSTTIPTEMQITDGEISDGTTAAALQAARSEEIWVQDPVLGIPMLKIFANEETEQPSEALNGIFTINASGEKVSFAKGNLQKIGITYQFAEHQYDYFGTNQSDTHRDMYAFLAYSNPDNGESWSMLSRDEWKYLFATRTVTNTLSDGARYTMATLGGTYKGLIIFPDYYIHPEGADFTPGVFNSNSNYTAQVSLEGWALMEAAGCVFLPAAGYCSRGITWNGVGEYVCYMSTTPSGMYYYDPYFRPDGVYLDETSDKQTWSSIRLVLRLQPLNYTVPASGVGTFSSEVNIHLPEGLNAHYCKSYYEERSAISVVNISSGVVPANTGVLLSGTPGETFNLYPTPETAGELEGNALVAVTKPVHISPTKGDYTNFMMKGGKFIKIADESYTVKMPANRAYLPLLTEAVSGSNAKEIMLYWDDEEATGIERMRNVENEIMRNGNIYNLNGQKLSAPQKGINIINGRKVIVK